MKLEIKDTDIMQNGANTLLSCIGMWVIATAHFNPSQLTVNAPAAAAMLGTLMIVTGLVFSLVLGDVQ